MNQAEDLTLLIQMLQAAARAGSDRHCDEAISLITALPPEIRDLPQIIGTRGYCAMLRYKRHGSLDDLTMAVIDFKKALVATEPDDPAVYLRTLNVAWASEERFDRLGARGEQYVVIVVDGTERWRGPRDLVSPISWLENLLAGSRPDAVCPPEVVPQLKRNLGNLLCKFALAVKSRPVAARQVSLDRAIALLQDAMATAEPDSADYEMTAISLVSVVQEGQAAGLLPALMSAPGVDPGLLRQALEVAGSGAVVTEPAVTAFFKLSQAIQLVRDDRPAQGMELLAALAGQGASIPPSVGLEAAVTLAEVAFGRENWTEVVAAERLASVHLDALASRTLDLYSRDATSAQRGKLAALAAYAAARTGALDDALEILERGRTRMLAERFQTPVEAAGSTPGLAVQLIVTGPGGLALVCESSRATRAIWLPELSGERFRDPLVSYLCALDGMRRNSVLGLRAWMTEVASMVALLRTALEPLLSAFPRGALTVVPVGVLSLLPITAALLADDDDGDDGELVVSILPSLSAAPAGAARPISDAALVVTEPELPAARWETAGVRGFFGSSVDQPTDLTGPNLLAAFPPGGVAHFGCHAQADPGAPLRSALILPGDLRLTVQDILTSLPGTAAGTTVVLSACESGLAGPNLLDETIGLPIAFLAAGCDAVVSTLWVVEDLSTALVMLRFYWHWRHESRPRPQALAQAMIWLRSTSDQAKCRFAGEELVAAGVLSPGDGAELAGAIRDRSDSLAGNSFSEPYFWAGFYLTGRSADPAQTST